MEKQSNSDWFTTEHGASHAIVAFEIDEWH